MKNTKKVMALLLAGMMAFGGCGNSKDSGASDTEVKGGLEAKTDNVLDGSEQGAEAAESQPDEGSGEANDTEDEAQGESYTKTLHSSSEIRIVMTNLDLDDEKDEGTAYLELENKKADGTVQIEIQQASVDMEHTEVSYDGGIIELNAGESLNVPVRFANPNASKKLSESGMFELKISIDGTEDSSYVDGGWFIIHKNDTGTAAATPKDPTVEEAELYNANGLTATLTGMRISYTSEGNDILLKIRYTNSGGEELFVAYTDVYINDTLIRSGQEFGDTLVTDEDIMPGNTLDVDFNLGEHLDELAQEPHEISMTLAIIGFEEGSNSVRYVIDSSQVTIPVIYSE